MRLHSITVQDPPRKRTIEVTITCDGRCYTAEDCYGIFSREEKQKLCTLIHDIATSYGQTTLPFPITHPICRWNATVVDIATPHGVVSFGVSMVSEPKTLRPLDTKRFMMIWDKLSQKQQQQALTIGFFAVQEFESRSSSLC